MIFYEKRRSRKITLLQDIERKLHSHQVNFRDPICMVIRRVLYYPLSVRELGGAKLDGFHGQTPQDMMTGGRNHVRWEGKNFYYTFHVFLATLHPDNDSLIHLDNFYDLKKNSHAKINMLLTVKNHFLTVI